MRYRTAADSTYCSCVNVCVLFHLCVEMHVGFSDKLWQSAQIVLILLLLLMETGVAARELKTYHRTSFSWYQFSCCTLSPLYSISVSVLTYLSQSCS